MNKQVYQLSRAQVLQRQQRLLSAYLARETSEVTELLNLENIQGNVIPGFGMEFQQLLFFRIKDSIKDIKAFKDWLQFQLGLITSAAKVRFMRPLLKAVREGTLSTKTLPALKESWTNIAFTAEGLNKLGLRA